MTLITMVAKEDFVSIMTDGRLFDSKKNEVVDEHYCKYTRLSKDIVIAGAGSHDQIKQIIGIAQRFYDIGDDLNEVARKVKNKLINDVPREDYPHVIVNLALAGLNSNQEITAYTINNIGGKRSDYYKPKGKETFIAISTGEGVGEFEKDYEKLKSFFYKHESHSPETFLAAQKEYNAFVSISNKTVNTNHYHCLIEKN